jgi:hypothetical protein
LISAYAPLEPAALTSGADLGFVPLPAPVPLSVPIPAAAPEPIEALEAYSMPIAAGVTDPMDTGIPTPRVLMSNRPMALFVTRLYDQN